MKKLALALFICICAAAPAAIAATGDNSTKAERNFIRHGNELFRANKFHEALSEYEKAQALNPQSLYAQYNTAVTYMQLANDDNKDTQNDPRKTAAQIFKSISQQKDNLQLAEYSFYNLGNIAFNDKDFDTAIAMYKGALRINPDNRKARQNLLLSLQEKEKNQNQEQDQQDKQDQQEQKEQQQQQNQQQQEQQQNQQPQPMSQSAEQILQSVQNKENQTRRRDKSQQSAPIRTDKPW